MRGLMMDLPLLVSGFIEYAAENHGETEVVARELEGDIFRYTYAQAHARMKRLAMALARLGVQPGMPVGTLAWNTHRHFEMFYGVPGSGAVLHTVNPRLFPDQLVYIINHAEDRVLCLDAVTLPIVEQIAPRLTTVEKYVVLAAEDRMPQTRLPVLCYETLLAQEDERDFAWPRFDENQRVDDLLHVGHDRQSEGRRLLASRRACCRPCSPARSTSCPATRAARAKS